MRRHLSIALILICLAALASPAIAQQVPPVTPVDSAVVSVATVSAHPGETVSIPITMSGNTHTLAGIMVPVRYDASRLTFDSVDFTSSVITSDFITSVYSQPDSSYLWVTCYPDFGQATYVPITAASGLIATLVFAVNSNAPYGLADIDSVYEFTDYGGVFAETRVNFADSLADTTYYPQFAKGGVFVEMPTDVNTNDNIGLPTKFELAQNYPNPFNPTTMISFSLAKADHVVLDVFNVLGQKVRTLMDKSLSAGQYQVEFDASSEPSGIYFYRLSSRQGVATRKMVLVK